MFPEGSMYMIAVVICNTCKGGVLAQQQFLLPTMPTHYKPRKQCTDGKGQYIPIPSVVWRLKESGWYYLGTDMHLMLLCKLNQWFMCVVDASPHQIKELITIHASAN